VFFLDICRYCEGSLHNLYRDCETDAANFAFCS
jgi:hypothetical protein